MSGLPRGETILAFLGGRRRMTVVRSLTLMALIARLLHSVSCGGRRISCRPSISARSRHTATPAVCPGLTRYPLATRRLLGMTDRRYSSPRLGRCEVFSRLPVPPDAAMRRPGAAHPQDAQNSNHQTAPDNPSLSHLPSDAPLETAVL